MNANNNTIMITMGKSEVEHLDLSPVYFFIDQFRHSSTDHCNALQIVFDGYYDDPREIYAIPEIRNWVEKLVYTYPDVLYYLDEEHQGLDNILLCLSDIHFMKRSPTKVVSIEQNTISVQARIPLDKLEAISLQLVTNPYTLTNHVAARVSHDRLIAYNN